MVFQKIQLLLNFKDQKTQHIILQEFNIFFQKIKLNNMRCSC